MLLRTPRVQRCDVDWAPQRRERDADPPGVAAHQWDVVRPAASARGYCVTTVGLDEAQIRRSIGDQGKLQRDRDWGN